MRKGAGTPVNRAVRAPCPAVAAAGAGQKVQISASTRAGFSLTRSGAGLS
jgi:hypothetical protein